MKQKKETREELLEKTLKKMFKVFMYVFLFITIPLILKYASFDWIKYIQDGTTILMLIGLFIINKRIKKKENKEKNNKKDKEA